MQEYFTKYKTHLIGFALGAIAGFLYWRFVGCSSGTCPITSNWYTSSIYGSLMGVLLVGSNKKEIKKNESIKEEQNS